MRVSDFLQSFVRCPDCHTGGMVLNDATCSCRSCGASFPVINNKPVLIRHDNEVFPIDAYSKRRNGVANTSWLSKCIPSPSVNLAFVDSLKAIEKALRSFQEAHVLVLGAGHQRKRLDDFFSDSKNVHLTYCDVDTQALVDCFCDAHEIPFQDNTFQGVIATAVLEHVLYPERAVAEIQRVLSPGGIVYSEIPFVQQVHEGAYDFTRYTLSGHRRLFIGFQELSSGLIAGPGTALVWALENFALTFSWGSRSSSVIKASTRLGCFWLKYFDYLLKDKPQAIDGASCTYFLGRKDLSSRNSEKTIIDRYAGAQEYHHC